MLLTLCLGRALDVTKNKIGCVLLGSIHDNPYGPYLVSRTHRLQKKAASMVSMLAAIY